MSTIIDRPVIDRSSRESVSLDTAPLRVADLPAAARAEAKRGFAPIALANDIADLVIAFFTPIAVPMLRLALAAVYVWFGALKVLGLSPVADLVASMFPFLAADVAVIGMGWFEIALGAALALGVLVPWIAAVQIVHLLGTFLVFFVQPALVFDGTPFAVTLEGEFIAKNMVLVAALIVVATHTKGRRARSARA